MALCNCGVFSGQVVKSEQGERFPIPSLSPPLSFFLAPSFPSLSLPLPFLPLEVGPLNPAIRGLGSAVSSPARSGAEPQAKSNSVHFSLKIWHLVATILRINQLNKFRAFCDYKIFQQAKANTNYIIHDLKLPLLTIGVTLNNAFNAHFFFLLLVL